LRPDRVLTSPAVRALTTASIMARELKVPAARIVQDERLYLAEAKAILTVVRELGGDAQHLMLFAHNPGITDCANELSAGERIDNMPTCGIFTALFAVDDWSRLEWTSSVEAEFDYPRNLA
ncbi:MAG: SixA phosphatase family protein, partial [Steroidobacteraceae bacterium]